MVKSKSKKYFHCGFCGAITDAIFFHFIGDSVVALCNLCNKLRIKAIGRRENG